MLLQALTTSESALSAGRGAPAHGFAIVHLPTALVDHTGGEVSVRVPASTIGGALHALVARHPAVRRHMYTDTGDLRGYVNIFLNENEVRTLPSGVATRVAAGDVLMIVPSIAGG